MDLSLRGRNVLITGASQGIGAGAARAFAEEGCNLKLVARSVDGLEKLASELRAAGVVVNALALDMTQAGAIDEVAAFGADVDVLINNAGTSPAGTLWDVDEVAWRQGWELKVFGYINLTRAVYPAMKARGAGVIINNIGTGGQNPDYNYIAGSSGNAALMAFTLALGGRSLEDGIRVIGVNPGATSTERNEKVRRAHAEQLLGDADRAPELLKKYPLGRAATVREIADVFVFLASERANYVSGTIVTVDGGYSSRRSIT